MPELLPDPDAVEKWRSLPQNKPSREAYPPAFSGLRTNRALWFGFGIVMLILLVLNWIAVR